MGPVLFLLAAAHLSGSGSLRAWVEANDKRVEAAMRRRDIVAIVKIVREDAAPGYTYADGIHKPMGLEAVIANMKRSVKMYSELDASSKILSVQEHGDTGSCVAKQTQSEVAMGRDRKNHRIVVYSTSTSTYRKMNGAWRQLTKAVKIEQITVDGKPIPVGAARR